MPAVLGCLEMVNQFGSAAVPRTAVSTCIVVDVTLWVVLVTMMFVEVDAESPLGGTCEVAVVTQEGAGARSVMCGVKPQVGGHLVKLPSPDRDSTSLLLLVCGSLEGPVTETRPSRLVVGELANPMCPVLLQRVVVGVLVALQPHCVVLQVACPRGFYCSQFVEQCVELGGLCA